MKVILLSGGSGKRLWPLSNELRSKQFLKVINGRNGELNSMLQNIWSHLCSLGMDKDTVIATNRKQVQMIYSQIGTEANIVREPEIWDTFASIALSCTYLYSVQKVSLNETIVVLPVDSNAEDWFYKRISLMERVLSESKSNIALVGIKPTGPSDKYGYIVPFPSEQDIDYIKISKFVEKPAEEDAAKLISEGALWNSGIFAFKLSYIIDILNKKNFPTDYNELLDIYTTLPKSSFDIEVAEFESNIAAIQYDGTWVDLGTWNELANHMSNRMNGPGFISEDSINSHVINELNIPVVVMGIPDAIIAASPDGVLVSSKKINYNMKQLAEKFTSRPKYEEGAYGWIQILDYTKLSSGDEVVTRRIRIKQDKYLKYEYHEKRSETWKIISGEAYLYLDGLKKLVVAGDIIEIPVGSKHGLKTITEMDIIEIQIGSEISDEDCIQLIVEW